MRKTSIVALLSAASLVAGITLAQAEGSAQADMKTSNANKSTMMMKKPMMHKSMMHKKMHKTM